MTDSENIREVSHSKDLLDVGKRSTVIDQLLVTRPKPSRLPPSSALSKVKSFLPKLHEANQSLQERLAAEPSENLDIENVEECTGPIIEMNLAIQENSTTSSESDTLDSSSDSTPSSSEDSSSEETGLLDEISTDNIKISNMASNKRKRPIIEVLSGQQNSDDEEEEETPIPKDR